jgi:hypothetical protein
MPDPQPSFQRVKKALTDLQSDGQGSVAIAPLLEFIERAEADSPFDGEILRMHHENELARMKLNQDGSLEMFRSVIETAKVALTTSILVNGGATVALLALVGAVIGKASGNSSIPPAALVYALISFALGVLAGAIATGTTYCSQYCYHQEFNRSASAFHAVTVILVLASYVAFLSGVASAYHGFIK